MLIYYLLYLQSDFGGKPKPIILNGKKHYFRLTALPRGVKPGFHTILNMEGGRLPSPPPCALPAPPQLPASLEQAMEFKRAPFLQPPPPLGILPPISKCSSITLQLVCSQAVGVSMQ